MKSIVFMVLFLCLFGFVNGQTIATSFPKATANGTSLEVLDSLYSPAISSGADSVRAVFKGKEKEFQEGYLTMLKALAKHLQENGFSWGKQTRCFNRIYFNEQGTIDYFLFFFKPGVITAEKEEQFEKLLGTFARAYKFSLATKSKFAQCSPVTYLD